jgi:hypothetical protein
MTCSLRRKFSLALVVQPCRQLPFVVPVRALSHPIPFIAPPPGASEHPHLSPSTSDGTYVRGPPLLAPVYTWGCSIFQVWHGRPHRLSTLLLRHRLI